MSQKSEPTKTRQANPMKNHGGVQCSIQLGSPEALAKKILNTPVCSGKGVIMVPRSE